MKLVLVLGAAESQVLPPPSKTKLWTCYWFFEILAAPCWLRISMPQKCRKRPSYGTFRLFVEYKIQTNFQFCVWPWDNQLFFCFFFFVRKIK